MAENYEGLELRLVGSESNPALGEVLNLEASIVVAAFTGRSSFWVSREDLGAFVEQLRALTTHLPDSARIECGAVKEDAQIIYFSCHVERMRERDDFLAHVSLGTTGSDELLHRLHVGLRVKSLGLTEFSHAMEALLVGSTETAALRAARSAA